MPGAEPLVVGLGSRVGPRGSAAGSDDVLGHRGRGILPVPGSIRRSSMRGSGIPIESAGFPTAPIDNCPLGSPVGGSGLSRGTTTPPRGQLWFGDGALWCCWFGGLARMAGVSRNCPLGSRVGALGLFRGTTTPPRGQLWFLDPARRRQLRPGGSCGFWTPARGAGVVAGWGRVWSAGLRHAARHIGQMYRVDISRARVSTNLGVSEG